MKKKVIIPDFTPRKNTPQKPIIASAPIQNIEGLPDRIQISESQKLPIFVPPPPPPSITRLEAPAPQQKYITLESARASSLTVQPFSGPTQNAAPASFSPNLETFTGIDTPYFATLADLPDIAQWSLYPAISTINVAGNNVINAYNIYASTINSYSTVSQVLDLDGNNLTTAGQELLFNGQPLATVSSVTSNITGWSLYPAISTIFADNNAVTGVTDIQLSSINGQIFPPPIPLPAWVSTATSQLDMSNYGITNISSLDGVSSINGAAFPYASQWISTAASALDMGPYNIAVSSLTGISSLNGTAFPGPVADVSLWANYVASSNVTIPNKDLNMTTTSPGVSYNKANLNANVQFGDPTNVPLRPDFDAYCGTVTLGGLTTPLTAMNVNSIGGINLTSATGVSVQGGGGVAISGGGAVSVLGLGGVAVNGGGAVSVNGTGGVSVIGSGAISVAAGGVLVSGGGVAITAGGVAITAGGLSIASGITAIGSPGLGGGGINVYGSDIHMLPVGPVPAEIYTEYLRSESGTNTMQILGVSTINGAVYPPTAGAVDINGLLNKINAFPVLPYTSASSSTPAANQSATAIVPDGSFPVNVPTVGAVQGGWGFSKTIGSAAFFNWYMYNPRFGNPTAPLPYVKSKIQSVWALIRPTVNLYSAGYLALNLYSFDAANPPTSGFFNTRWAYSNVVGAVAGATGVNLFAGYTYLIYANDTPRITNASAIGVPDSQVSTLRDPYDIYTDVNHIALSNCIVAFNPWTNGTNYKTWSAVPATPFLVGDTVIFAGQGTNYNGLFFIAGPGIPTPATPPMVNGVVSANWALISPQPSSYADQPILAMNINQSTASGQAVGYVVLDMGWSYGPSTISTTVSEHISLLPN